VDVSLLSPLPASRVLGAIRPSVRHVIVLEQVKKWITKWTPLFLDVVSVLQHRDSEDRPVVRSAYLGDTNGLQSEDVAAFLESATTSKPSTRTRLGEPTLSLSTEVPHVPKHESSYTSILNHLFGERLEISNSPSLVLSQGELATNPEFALGRVRGALEERNELLHAVCELLQDPILPPETHALLSRWVLVKVDIIKSQQSRITSLTPLQHAFCLRKHFRIKSRWIIGSDAWSYDLGTTGIHHATVSGLDVNTFILDTLPYTARNSSDPTRRKHDISDCM
jgi:sulfite reductase (NADPH) hemoprotein beta-component